MSKIDFNKLTLRPGDGYRVDATGTVHVVLVADDNLLGSDSEAEFSLLSPPVVNDLRVARDLDDQLIGQLGGHDRNWVRDWRDRNPGLELRTVKMTESRKYQGSVTIEMSPDPKP